MATPPDFISTLQDLVDQTNGRTVYVASPQSSIQVTKTGDVDPGRLLASFQAAYPDMTFETFTDDEGRRGIRSLQKAQSPSPIGASLPAGYSPILADQGLRDLQAALENAQDDEERFSIATKLNTLVQTQKAFRYTQYKQRSESEFGVPELESAIENVRQAELRSPFNPGNGMPSQQRLALIEQLGVARSRAGQRIGEFMQTDTALVGAENLAKGTIAEIEGRMKLAGMTEILNERRAKKAAREAAISSMNPSFVQSASVLAQGKLLADDKELGAFAASIYDGKVKLTETQRAIANADDDSLLNFYYTAKNPKDKQLVLNVLDARERIATGNEEEAKRNMQLFKTISGLDLNDQKDPRITPQMKERWKQLQTQVVAQAAASGKSKDEMLAAGANALRRELMAQAVKASFYSDVSNWDGLIKADESSKVIIQQAKKEGIKALSFKDFVDRYLDFNDGKSLQDKSKNLQAALISGISAMPNSAVLPIPSQESLQLEAQALIAQRVSRRLWDPRMAAPPPFNIVPILRKASEMIRE